MPSFSKRSLGNLGQCHPILQEFANECIRYIDFTVVCGYRNEADQTKAFRGGFSRAKFGESPHNYKPALAFDAYLFPIDVNSLADAHQLVGGFKAIIALNNFPIKCGADFKKSPDLPHFELVNWQSYIK